MFVWVLPIQKMSFMFALMDNKILTIHSNNTRTIPLAAPAPARPMKCSLPMLLPNMEAPTWKKDFTQMF